MKSLILLILLAFSIRLIAADGDVTVRIRPDGWSAVVTVEGAAYAIGATVTTAMGTNGVPGANTPYLTVTSKKHTATGSTTTGTRTVYITDFVRFPMGTATTTGTWSADGSFTSGTFLDGETVTQAVSGATGIVVGQQSAGTKLYGKIQTGSPNSSNIWTGGTSGATFTPSAVPVVVAESTADQKDTGTGLDVLVSLSQYVYADDDAGGSGTDITLTCPASFVVSGANNSSARSAASVVTNGSTQPYQPTIAAWTWPGYRRVTGAFNLSASVWNGQTGGNAAGTPGVACVVFTVSDGTTTETQTIPAASIDSTMPDREKVQEYMVTFNASSFIALNNLTCNFKVYPTWGDSTNTFDTSTTSLTPAAAYGPQTLLCDKSDTYGRTFAVVDAAAANDTSGVCVDRASYASDTLAEAACTPYKTIGKAAAGIAAYNNTNRSRNDVGAGEICLTAGSYNWLGSSNSYGTTPATWVKIRPKTGTARDAAIISGTLNNTDISDRVWLSGVNVTTTTISTFSGISHLWNDGCIINCPSTVPFHDIAGGWYLTHNFIQDLNQGITPYSNNAYPLPILVRGNLFAGGFSNSVMAYTVIGNVSNTVSSTVPRFTNRVSTASTAPRGTMILAFNRVLGFNSGGSLMFDLAKIDEDHDGMVMAFNTFEMINNNTQGLGSTGSSTGITDGRITKNFIIWNNVFAGQRVFMAYNDTGTASLNRTHWSVKNNCWDITGMKSDSFGTHNAKRIGNWPVMWSVNFTGNIVFNVSTVATPSFDAEFAGMYCQDDGGTNTAAFPKYTDRRAYSTSSILGSGLGRYSFRSDTPAKPSNNVGIEWMLPCDVEGQPVNGPHAGPYKIRGSAVQTTGATKIQTSGSTVPK